MRSKGSELGDGRELGARLGEEFPGMYVSARLKIFPWELKGAY